MARYRAKPVELDAVQWTGDNYQEVCAFAGSAVSWPGYPDKSWDLIVHTAEGDTTAPIRFYIARDDRGCFYPCDPGVFERKYEPVDPT